MAAAGFRLGLISLRRIAAARLSFERAGLI